MVSIQDSTKNNNNKHFLYKINYIDSNVCNFCHTQPETLEHLFYLCPKVLKLWKDIEQWIGDNGENIILDKNTILFGIIKNRNIFINWLIVNIKYYIYRMKIQKHGLKKEVLFKIISKKLNIEKYRFYKNCHFKEFDEQWAPWQIILVKS